MYFLGKSTYQHDYFLDEAHVSHLYPLHIQLLDKSHWSPLIIIKKACQFLAEKSGVRILDIGSGSGKFCLAGAYCKPHAFFSGVEQRRYLVDVAHAAQEKLGKMHVKFKHANFTEVDFNDYDHFYFYDPFFENLPESTKIDDTVEHSCKLFEYYNRLLSKKLREKPIGTKIVTYRSMGFEILPGYVMVDMQMNKQLKFWVKYFNV